MPRRSASARSGRCGKSGLTLIAVALFHGSISRSRAAASSSPAKFGMRPCGGNRKCATPSAASRSQTQCRPQYQADCACLRSRPDGFWLDLWRLILLRKIPEYPVSGTDGSNPSSSSGESSELRTRAHGMAHAIGRRRRNRRICGSARYSYHGRTMGYRWKLLEVYAATLLACDRLDIIRHIYAG